MAASTIWAQLSPTFPAVGSIIYIGTDGQSTIINAQNLWFDPTNLKLSVSTNGDQTGTDSINTYGDIDAYGTVNTTRIASGYTMNGNSGVGSFSASAARTSGIVPTLVQSGDPIGKYSYWGYTATPDPTNTFGGNYPSSGNCFVELGYIGSYASGNTSSVLGIGGELRFAVKPDNAPIKEVLKLTSTFQFTPIVAATASLGATGLGWHGVYLSYTLNAVPGATATINSTSGRATMSSGRSTFTVTNSLVTSTSLIFISPESNDATLLYVKTVAPNNGSFLVTFNANATANYQFSFLVVNN